MGLATSTFDFRPGCAICPVDFKPNKLRLDKKIGRKLLVFKLPSCVTRLPLNTFW
jgi:hypothetical protein